MLGEISFVILREIIKRIIEFESIDNLIKLNKKFKKLIINDRVCQERYLFIKYNLIIEKDHLELIKNLNSKSYSRYIGKGSVINNDFNIFVRPKDDSFIIEYESYDDGSPRIFNFCADSMISIIKNILDKKIENYEEILISKGFYYLNANIKKYFFSVIWNHEDFLLDSCWSVWYNGIGEPKIFVDQTRIHLDDFNSKVLEVFDKLKN